MTRVSLGIDLGTSSLKTVAIDESGRVVAAAQIGYGVDRPRPGWAEQSPDQWWAAACDAITATLAQSDVVAVGVGGQMHGLVCVDAHGTALRPAIIWSDARSARQVEEWDTAIGSDRVESVTGMPIATGMLGVSLTWVRDNEPDVYARTVHVFSPKDYLRYRLTGQIGTEPTDAAAGLLFDIHTGRASAEIAGAVGLRTALLAPVGASLAPAGTVTKAAAEQTGIRAGTIVAFGGGDQAMGALALGLQDAGRAAVAISSGGTVFKRTDRPLDPSRGLHVMPYLARDQWMAMGVVLSAGLSIDWLVTRVFGQSHASDSVARLMAEADAVPAGAAGLLASPHVGGTRTPRVDDTARAAFSGLGYAHGQPHLIRAVVEGVCISLSESLESMAAAGDPARELVISGGGARFAIWRRTLADVTGLPVAISSDLEHSAIGAALAGARAADVDIRFDAAARVSATVEPEPAAHAAYQDIAARLRRWERATASADIRDAAGI